MRPEEIVDFVEALARITASGGGPKALAAHLARTAGGGVLLEDAQWRHLAAAGSQRIPPSARSVVESGAPGKVLRVTSGDTHLGWLSLFGTNSAPDAEVMLRLTGAAIGVELVRDAFGSRVKKSTFWNALLSESLSDLASAREEAATHGIALAQQYCVVVLEAEAAAATPDALVATELRALAADVFAAGEAELGFFREDHSLFVFVPAARAVDANNAKTAAALLPRTAARRKSQLRITGGVGTVEPLASLYRSGATARAALTIGRRLFGPGHVASYEELGAYSLLYEGADVARLRAFAAEVLAPLRAYDEKHQTELERTLKLYFGVGQNVKTASESLNVHRHTVFYRLRQIAEITSRSLENPHDQLTLRMAMAIDDLHA
ncbi:MAG: helix-turn-helix domain-containing protein [Candidatus Cybelea sp.]